MCQIQFTIQTNDVDGDSIKAVQMRYRQALSSGTWILEEYPSITNITNATILQTPNLIVDGLYEFELQVQDANDDWSAWFSDPNNPTFQIGNCAKPSNSFYVGLGKCQVIPTDWISVWTPSGNVGSYIPVVGDILYIDSSFTTPYSSASLANRLGFSPPPNVLMSNNSYNIDGTGKITSIVNCDVSGGNDAVIVTPAQDSGCDSCMSVRVDVPSGETREVSITQSGLAGYSGISLCRTGTVVGSNINETISATKTYSFGLDAASGSENAQSSITLSVSGSNSITLNRSHQSPVINC